MPVYLAIGAGDADLIAQVVGAALVVLALCFIIGALAMKSKAASKAKAASAVLGAVAALLFAFPIYRDHILITLVVIVFIAWAWLLAIWGRRSFLDAIGLFKADQVDEESDAECEETAGAEHQRRPQPERDRLGSKDHPSKLGDSAALRDVFGFATGVAIGLLAGTLTRRQ